MNSKTIGNIGEAVAIAEFTKHNIPVLIPFGDNERYDLVVVLNGEFKKIQIKTTESLDNKKLEFKIRRTGKYEGKTTNAPAYTQDEIDYFFLYSSSQDQSYLISMSEISTTYTITLRLEKPKNNQTKGIRLAEDFIFTKKINEIMSK